MPQTQISCPNCRQMIPAQVEQLFDVTADPEAKQRFLSGQVNVAQCPYCGYQGPLATPIVYHDADKELLLTYFPPELGLPANEQEKLVGPLINQVVNRLPLEKRKAYLLQPKNFLTLQSLIEHILQADGISPEMVREQQEQLRLLERLLATQSADVRAEIIRQNDEKLGEAFFALLSQLFQNALMSSQQDLAQALNVLQSELMQHSTYGRKLQTQLQEVEAAAQSLQNAGEGGLTREKLLQIVREAPSDDRLQALVSLARPGFDYIFFQQLTEQIEAAEGEERAQLENLRDKLLAYTAEVDEELKEQVQEARAFLENLLEQPDTAAAVRQNLQAFNEVTIQALNDMIQEAAQKQDQERMQKLEQVVGVLRAASAPPPEYALIEKLLAQPDEAAIQRELDEHAAEVTDEFMQLLSGLLNQVGQNTTDPEAAQVAARLEKIYQLALRLQMKRNLRGEQ